MPSRRQFLQWTAAVSAVQPLERVGAASPPRRVALVIGNERYPDIPLRSAANDAQAMAALLGDAGFAVDRHLNLTRGQMAKAIEDFGRAIAAPDCEMAFFYYAGHAAQLDWRNYLLPVDGDVASASDVRRQCIDLATVLGQLGKSPGRVGVIVIDACRDDPFGGRYRPSLKGLSQYDAPPGTLLAFATAPGRVSIEVAGARHGLYTEHLLRELAIKGVRIEDALKRVRLAVRVASRGAQIPWESTSLEKDVYLFAPPRLSEAQLESQFRAELEMWNRIKGSQDIDAWSDYLRQYPNGKFAEIGQIRVARLLSERERRIIKVAAPTAGVRLGAGLAVPDRLNAPESPNSAGSYAFEPIWTVGDEYVYDNLDLYSGVRQQRRTFKVLKVEIPADRVTLSNGLLLDLSGAVARGEGREFDVPLQLNPAQLQIGRRWSIRFIQSGSSHGVGEYELRVVGRERVTVPAGTFSAFRIEASGWFIGSGATTAARLRTTRWLVPGLNLEVRRERAQFGDARVLVSAQQRA